MDIQSLLHEITTISNGISNFQKFNNSSQMQIPFYCEPKLSPKYRLMIDKRFMPSSYFKDSHELRTAWMNFAVGTACYAYRTIGKEFSKEFKILLANSAVVAVLSGFLAEYEDKSTQRESTGDNIQAKENICEPDDYWECVPDGEWFHGLWTTENSATVSDMESVLDQETSEFCFKLLITAMESYYYTNCFYPDMTTFPHKIINNELMTKYGTEESLRQLMHIIGHWISKLNVFSVIGKYTNSRSNLIPVRVLGNRKLCLTHDIWIRFNDLPCGWTLTNLAYRIAEKLVQHKCITLFEDYDSLIKLKNNYDKICHNAFDYHVDRKYLTGSSKEMEIDNGCGLLGRLITFLKYAEPDSDLFSSSYLKYNDETCEEYYDDYDGRWESFMKIVHATKDETVTDMFLKCFLSKYYCGERKQLVDCWNKYNVSDEITSRISVYFNSHEDTVYEEYN
ncbi:hypothetical protein KSF78_0004638 [Schistosoma japonicum]|nr:hypothetical protein KSF78_0004638 [Schistosoma japonicum]